MSDFSPGTRKFLDDMKKKLKDGGNWLTYWEVAALIDIAEQYINIAEMVNARLEMAESLLNEDEE